MKLELLAIALLMVVGVMASNTTPATDAATPAAASPPAAKKTKKVKQKKNSCFGSFVGACCGSNTGAKEIVGDAIDLAEEVAKAKEDGNINDKEAKDIAKAAAVVAKDVGEGIEEFKRLNEETVEVEVPVDDVTDAAAKVAAK